MKRLTLSALLVSLLVLLVACPPATRPDTEKPTLSVTTPVKDATVTTEKITVTGKAEDTVGVTKLTIKVNDAAVQDITASLKDDKTFSTEVTLKAGENTIVVTAMDAAENSFSVTRKVTFDTAKPFVTFTSPEEGVTVTSAALMVEGVATDNVGVTKLTIQVNDAAAQDITASLKDNQTFATEVTLKAGENTIVVTAMDESKNSVSATRKVTLDATNPVLTIASPQEGETVYAAKFMVKGTADDNAAVTKLTIQVNDAAAQDITSSLKADKSFMAEVSVKQGANKIVVTAMDAQGNTTALTRNVTFTPDTKKPVLRISSPARNNMVIAVPKIMFKGTLTDNVAVTVFTVKLNGTLINMMDKLVDGKFETELTLRQGENTFQITASDAAGNSEVIDGGITVSDMIPPVVTITSPSVDGVTVPSQTITVAGSARDNLAVTKLTLQINDGAVTDITNDVKDGVFNTTATLKNNLNTITVTAMDAKGNTSQDVRTVIFNPTANTSISGTIWFDANGNGVYDNGEPHLAGRTVFLDTNNNSFFDSGEVSVKTDTNGKYVFNNLAPGTYHVNQVLAFGESFATATSSSNTLNNSVSLDDVVLEQARGISRIVGGVDANIGDFPFMLALGRPNQDGSFRQFCGATLISRYYAVTAAHCVERYDRTLSVLIGTDTLSDKSGTVIRVEQVISHPQYRDVAKGFDVAVLKLVTPVDLSKYYTVDMIDASTVQFTNAGTVATAIGWGALASGARGSARLQMVHTKIFDATACEQAYIRAGLENFDTQICAGVPEGGVDACQGDSGGPLFVRGERNGKKRWFHAGATSWGYGCAWAGFPGIWARTSVLQPWIVSQAIESSASQKVVISDSNVSDINFANKSTVRPLINEIEPRWQTTNFTLTTENRGFFVKPNTSLEFTWNIFAEAGATYNYTCTFTVATRGTAASSTSTPVTCALGENKYTVAGGIDQGSRVFSLEVKTSKGKQNRQRSAGLLASTISGELTDSDPKDPDYGKTYYMDYVELTGLTVGDKVTLVLEPKGFSPYLSLYDKSKRNPQSGGGKLAESRSMITFTVEAGIEYLIGVSTYNEKQTGTYELLTSQGTLKSFTFPVAQ